MTSTTSSHKPVKTPRIPEDQPLNENEVKIIASLRDKYASELTPDISENTMIRFVRGYKDDPHPAEKADAMFGIMLKWRRQHQVPQLISSSHPKLALFQSIWQQGLHGVSKQGHPVYVDRIGAVDGTLLMKHFTMKEITELHIQMMEKITAEKDRLSSLYNKRIYKQIVILDLKGLGMSHMSSKFTDPMKQFIQIDQDYYPETLFVMIIVNASWVVKSLWTLLSPFIDPITKQNIKWGKESIAEYIDDYNVPRFLGGKCACTDGKCLQMPFQQGSAATCQSLTVGNCQGSREDSRSQFRPESE